MLHWPFSYITAAEARHAGYGWGLLALLHLAAAAGVSAAPFPAGWTAVCVLGSLILAGYAAWVSQRLPLRAHGARKRARDSCWLAAILGGIFTVSELGYRIGGDSGELLWSITIDLWQARPGTKRDSDLASHDSPYVTMWALLFWCVFFLCLFRKNSEPE